MTPFARLATWWDRIRQSKAVKRAMADYRTAHPVCEWDGCRGAVQVHHIIPVHVRPELAAEPSNLITLGARRCHLCVGHAGDFRARWVVNVRELCAMAKIGKEQG